MENSEAIPEGGKNSSSVARGCVIAVVILLLLLVVAAVMAFFAARWALHKVTDEVVRPAIIQQVEGSYIPPDQKIALKDLVNGFFDDVDAGKVDYTDPKSWVEAGRRGMYDFVAPLDFPEAEKAGVLKEVDRLADLVSSGEKSLEDLGGILEELFTNSTSGLLLQAWTIRTVCPGSEIPVKTREEFQLQVDRLRGWIAGGDDRGEDFEKVQVEFRDLFPEVITFEDGDTTSIEIRGGIPQEEIEAMTVRIGRWAGSLGLPEEPSPIEHARVLRQSIDKALDK